MTKEKIINVLLVDNHTMLRKGMVMLLSEKADITVVGDAGDDESAMELISTLQPDVVVMASGVPQLNSVETTKKIVSSFPHIKVIAFSSNSSKQCVDDMLSAGAVGCLLKESTLEELVQGIFTVSRGERYLSDAINSTVVEAYVRRISKEQSANRPKEDLAILRTKLHPPTCMLGMVPRIRLIDQLDAAQVQPLILLSAPAGYGKSLLVSSWLTTCGWSSAWLSLDQSDSDIRQFLLYFVAAVHDIFPNTCKQTLSTLKAPYLPSVSTLVACLSNELDQIKIPFILVLDDYYRIDAESPVNDLLYRLLEYPPVPLHLVIVTRRDPPLQLVTLRANNQITELRIKDLYFSREETQALLQNIASFSADDKTLDDLERQIEGWAVGLCLVSQVLRSKENRDDFLQNLHSSVLLTNAYLLQEVFVRQTPEMQDCLLRTSILERFCTPLCEVVCNIDMAQEINAENFIDELVDTNLFIIPLDSEGKWFRLHHLFQQLLQHELAKRMSSDAIAELHVHASQWFKSQQFVTEAIQHLMTANDTVGAAKIIEQRYRMAEEKEYGWRTIHDWLSLLPAEIKNQRPRLIVAQVWVMHFRFQLFNIAPLVQQLELLAKEKPLPESCALELKIFKAVLYYWTGKGEAAIQLFLKAQKMIPRKVNSTVGLIDTYLLMAGHMVGQGEIALQKLNNSIEQCDQSNQSALSRLMLPRSFSYILSGKLTPAVQNAQRMNNIVEQSNFSLIYGWGDYLEASCYLRLNKLQPALERFSSAVKLQHIIHTRIAMDSMIGLALVNQAMGKSDVATDTIEELLKFIKETGQQQLLVVAQSGQARLALEQGDLELAADWVHFFDEIPSASSMFLWLENPAMTKARVLLAIDTPKALSQANNLLSFLREENEALHNTCQLIEIMVLQILVLEKLGCHEEVFATLEQTIALSEPGGWLRPFVEAGQPMLRLINRLEEKTGSTDYLQRMFAICKSTLSQPGNQPVNALVHASLNGETLTNRELDILELLNQRLQNKEMAAQLFVSPETVKTHLKNLYLKLGVNNRREAASFARDVLLHQ